MNTLLLIATAFLVVGFLFTPNLSIVLGKEKPLEPNYACDVLTGGQYVRCCQLFIRDDGSTVNYCTVCENTNPPSNCIDRIGEDVSGPPTGGVSDDPEAGDNPNPGIPPTGGVADETENDDNSGSDNESSDTPTNTLPNKGGSVLDPSNSNENVFVQ